MRILRLIVVGFLLFPLGTVFAQPRQAYFDQASRIILPEDYSPSLRYPVLVCLPWTGGTSVEFYQYYSYAFAGSSAIILLPPGRPQRSHYLPDFLSFVENYAQRVRQDIETLSRSYAADLDRIYLAGYSLGGDLSWALYNRFPRAFAGAMAFGTRSSYPFNPDARGEKADAALFFGIGNAEHPDRSSGIERAYNSIRSIGIRSQLKQYNGAHTNPPLSMVAQAAEFIGLNRQPARQAVESLPAQQTTPGSQNAPVPPEGEQAAPSSSEAGQGSPETAEPVAEVQTHDDFFSSSRDWFSDESDIQIPGNWDSWDDGAVRQNENDGFFDGFIDDGDGFFDDTF